ncbi:MAG: PAS domain S-box protein, partial [Akkermansiaceae bacterium]|nr:PAS domain S-box protein [Akkermansiaceae bacterium]
MDNINKIEVAPDGSLWFGSWQGDLIRYRPAKRDPDSPEVVVTTDRDYTDLANLPEVATDQRVSFKFGAIDFVTAPEKRQYRWQLYEGERSSEELAANWEPASTATVLERSFAKKEAGTWTLAVQFIDRDLNYSAPTFATMSVKLPWHANAAVTVPAGAGVGGLLLWAVVARMMYARKRKEARRLREEMLEQEHEARVRLEGEVTERQQAQEYFKSLVQHVPVQVIRRDVEGIITFVNKAMEEFWEKKAGWKIAVGQGWDDQPDWMEPENVAHIKASHDEIIQTGKIFQREALPFEFPSGEEVWLRDILTPIREADGTVTGIQGIIWDVTE